MGKRELKIICPNCKQENLVQSKYCFNCGTNIEAQRDEIYKQTSMGKLDTYNGKYKRIKKVYSIITDPFKVILSNKIVKIFLILVFIGLSIYMYITNNPLWNKLAIVSNDDYKVTYKDNMYVLNTDKDLVELRITCAKKAKTMNVNSVKNYNKTDVVDNKTSKLLVIKDVDYRLTVLYEDGTTEEINFIFK